MRTEAVGEDERFLHFGYHLLPSFPSKGRIALDQLKQQNSQAPNVDLVVVGLLLDHFGSHVLKGTAESGAILEDGCEAKVAEFGVVILGDEDVLWFDVPVHVVVLVEVPWWEGTYLTASQMSRK